MTSALLIARLILVVVFFVAGVAKLLDLTGARAAMAAFGVPKSLAAPFGVALPIAEVVVAIVLIPAASFRWGALGALALLGLFVAGIANVMVRGRETECHCFGQLHSSRVVWSTLGRSLVLAVVAGFVFASERDRSAPSYLEWIRGLSGTALLAVCVGTILIAVLAFSGWFMIHLLRQHGRMLLRLDTLEKELATSEIFKNQAGTADGLAPGVTAPAFTLPDLLGHSITLVALLAPGPPLLPVFSHQIVRAHS